MLKSVLGSACGLALAAAALAQTPPPATPPAVPKAQPPAGSPPVTSYPVQLYRLPDVTKTLTLTPEQVNRLNTVTNQVQTRYRTDYVGLGSLPEAQRAARMQELNRQYYADWNKASRDVFNDTQRARYQQLAYQYGGFNAMYEPDVQTRLGLTPAQTKALADQVAWSDRQLQEINRIGATDPTKGAEAYRAYWDQRQQRLNTFLTPQQQKTWRELTGDPYAFQPVFVPQR